MKVRNLKTEKYFFFFFLNYGANPALLAQQGWGEALYSTSIATWIPQARTEFQQAHPREALQDMIKYRNFVCLHSLTYSARKTYSINIFF